MAIGSNESNGSNRGSKTHGVLCELSLDHERLDSVDRVDIGHAVLHDPAHRLETLPRAHHRHSVALHQDVAVGEELQRPQGGAIRAHEPLSPLDEALLIADHAPDLDDVRLHLVLQDLDGLLHGHAARQELDEVAGFQDNEGISRLSRRLDCHGALDQVELAGDPVLLQLLRHQRPDLL